MRQGVSKSRIPTLLAAFYALSFAVALYLDSITQGMGPWGFFVILLTYPWSVLLMFFAAWSMAHSGYPFDYYFIPCALINVVGLFLLAKWAIRRPK